MTFSIGRLRVPVLSWRVCKLLNAILLEFFLHILKGKEKKNKAELS